MLEEKLIWLIILYIYIAVFPLCWEGRKEQLWEGSIVS